jgi:hypothetical protein
MKAAGAFNGLPRKLRKTMIGHISVQYRNKVGTAEEHPNGPYAVACPRQSEKWATARAKYQATHIVRIKKDVLLRSKEEGLPP